MSRSLTPRRRVERSQIECDKWNAANPVGTAVTVLRDNGDKQPTKTRSEAYISNSGDAVIFVEGITGYYLLSRCTPTPAAASMSSPPTIASEWEHFKSADIAPDAPAVQVFEMRKAFYAGIASGVKLGMILAPDDLLQQMVQHISAEDLRRTRERV